MVATVDHFLRLFCMSAALRACKQRLLFWRRQGVVDDLQKGKRQLHGGTHCGADRELLSRWRRARMDDAMTREQPSDG